MKILLSILLTATAAFGYMSDEERSKRIEAQIEAEFEKNPPTIETLFDYARAGEMRYRYFVKAFEKIKDLDINEIYKGRTLLMEAAYTGANDIVKFLLDHGADIEARTKQGRTPLFFAAGRYQPTMIKLLLEKGADVNVQDEDGYTVLMDLVSGPTEALAQQRRKDSVQAVLDDARTNLSLKNKHGWTALKISQLLGDAQITKLIQEAVYSHDEL